MVVDFKTKNVIESITDDPEINELLADIKESASDLNKHLSKMETLTKIDIYGIYMKGKLISRFSEFIALKQWGAIAIDPDFLEEALSESR